MVPAPESLETCVICGDKQEALLVNEAYAGKWQSACDHGACSACWRQCVDSQLPRCNDSLQLRLRCFAAGCGKHIAQQLVLSVSPAACDLADKLERRFDLEKNSSFPLDMQVNCPREGCVGIGYLGFDTAMCFICEHQWEVSSSPCNSFGCERERGFSSDSDLPETVKPCPRCNVLIEKDGGCDHITCPCGYEFFWETGEMWDPCSFDLELQ